MEGDLYAQLESEMRFSEEFLYPSASNDLVNHIQEEIVFLEAFKDFTIKRAKLELDHARMLFQLISTARRGHTYSPVQDAWNNMLNKSELYAREMATKANNINRQIIKPLKLDIANKKHVKRRYMSERYRFEQELLKIPVELQKPKKTYKEAAKMYIEAKKKYSEQLDKSKKKSMGKKDPKFEKALEKYVNAGRALHLAHNDYVLAVEMANAYQKAHNEDILCTLLDNLQEFEESAVNNLKEYFASYVNLLDRSYIQAEIVDSLHQIAGSIDKKAEYIKIGAYAKNQVSRDELPKRFQFESLDIDVCEVSEMVGGKNDAGVAGQLILNDLNYNQFFEKYNVLTDEYSHLRDLVQDKKAKMLLEDIGPHLGSTNSNSGNMQGKFPTIKSSSSNLFGKDEGSLDGDSVVSDDSTVTSQALDHFLVSLKHGLELAVLEANANCIDVQIALMSAKQHELGQRQPPNFLGGPPKTQPIPPSPVPAHRKIAASPSVASEKSATTEASARSETASPANANSISSQDWFFGYISRSQAEACIPNNGDYLVRSSTSKQGQYVLSLNCDNEYKHFIVYQNTPNRYHLLDLEFDSIQALLQHYVYTGSPVTAHPGAILRQPASRLKWEMETKEMHNLNEKKFWIVDHDDIVLGEKLGSGHFGEVYKAIIRKTSAEVAVKTCDKEYINEDGEADILRSYDHPNIVKLIGVCVSRRPAYIIMELLKGGDLAHFLRLKGHAIPLKSLLSMVVQVASGMRYLEQKNCVHRDLAARNILVNDTGSVFKISDFGMSRKLSSVDDIYDATSNKQVPIKWTSPEALTHAQYTVKSDVWSFGVLMWEVFSKGMQPYPGMNNSEVVRQISDNGYRMPPPKDMPEEVASIMAECWKFEPKDRPSFQEIHLRLSEIFDNF
eukprot:Nk52_evm11s1810 gene=Nk52_evmTU11s1810